MIKAFRGILGRIRKNDGIVLLQRLALVYAALMVVRGLFWFFNRNLIDPIKGGEVFSLLRGSLMFDTVSVLYLNLIFIVLSLLPFRFRANRGYQKALFILFMVFNGLGLLIAFGDVFYYPYKQSRMVLGDFALVQEGNFMLLIGDFVKDFWYGFLLYFALLAGLYYGYRAIRFRSSAIASAKRYYAVNAGWFVFGVAFSFFLIRGATFSAASYPLQMSDAFLYTNNPTHTSLVLSNPYCIIRTINKSNKVPQLHYFDKEVAESYLSVTHQPSGSTAMAIDRKTNVFIIILESFGKAHIKPLSDQFRPGQESYTPFLDSIISESYLFSNTFQNGYRSMDALPAIWASIPSFKEPFLFLPNSVAEYHALPDCMNEMGYHTAFLHGAVSESMGFVSFGHNVGVKEFHSREDYEAERGEGDFDGKWGIWDHKFLPYVAEKVDKMPKPFFSTLFTLSSHHPFAVPPGMEGKFKEGTLPIHRAIRYSDWALEQFFASIKDKEWFHNTLFIITADHASGADSEKFRKPPHNYSIPMLFYYPGKKWKGNDPKIMQHMDVMPTLLGMLGYDKPFFAFGNDHFSNDVEHFAINYCNGAFNFTTDSFYYQFNEKELLVKSDYRKDPLWKQNLKDRPGVKDEMSVKRMKAFLQQYYAHLGQRDFLTEYDRQRHDAVAQKP